MTCCGQRRAAVTTAGQVLRPTPTQLGALPPTASRPAPAPAPARAPVRPPAASLFGGVALRYLARSPVVVLGPVTGMEYRFSGADPVQPVARADRDALLQTGHFAMVG